jgi:hypothetical protein
VDDFLEFLGRYDRAMEPYQQFQNDGFIQEATALVRAAGIGAADGAAGADVLVGGRRLTQEAHVPPTKTQLLQASYSGKPARPPTLIKKRSLWNNHVSEA